MGKAQSDIISAVIIIVLAMGLIGTVYTWGIPLIEKHRSKAVVERLYSYFDRSNVNSLPRIIEDVANNGGEITFSSTIDGVWRLNEYDVVGDERNSIQFTVTTKVSNIGTNIGWIPLTVGATCPPSIGIVGTDEAGVVCARADSMETGYNITYSLWFRELDEAGGVKGYKINLVRQAGGPLSSTGNSIRITRGNIQRITEGGKTLIITEVKILLE